MTQTIGAITPFHARAQRTLSNLELALVWMIAKGAIQRMGAERPRSQKAQNTAQISAARLPHCLHVLAQKMLSIRLFQLCSTILRNYRTGRSLAAASGNSHWPCSGRWPIQTSAAASGNSQRRCSERWHSVAPGSSSTVDTFSCSRQSASRHCEKFGATSRHCEWFRWKKAGRKQYQP